MTAHDRHRDRLALRDLIRDVLVAAQRQRSQREHLVATSDGFVECAWAAYERGRAHAEVNRARRDRGLPPIDLREIERVERQAAGHSDYTAKFALYCAEMALRR